MVFQPVATPYTPVKYATFLWLLLALFGMFAGLQLSRTALFIPGVVLAFFSFLSAGRMVTRLIRIAALEQVLLSDSRSDLFNEFRQSSLAQQILTLLTAVAEIDGKAGPRERDLIRQFLLQRFSDPEIRQQLSAWNHKGIPPSQLGPLVHKLRLQLSQPECETIFFWCCLVALIDRRFDTREHEVLQLVSKHIGLPAYHARRIFHHAKHRILTGEDAASGQTGMGQGRPQSLSRRAQALEILGLPEGASKEEVRSRHRELVKKYHPDAHSHLGPIAAKEATERFQEVQEAYEILTA
ncbi:MAG: DnaJ domain-containing protein [Planctomycetota bacterium]|jgi:DnaJ-domain-containing protein 1